MHPGPGAQHPTRIHEADAIQQRRTLTHLAQQQIDDGAVLVDLQAV